MPDRIFSKLKVLFALPIALFESHRLLRQYKPTAVLGVGGYASGPFVLMASLAGFPVASGRPILTRV